MSLADSNSSTGITNNATGLGGVNDRPPSPASPIHSAPSLPSSSVTHFHKKSRKKRKELDALVPEEKIRRKNSFSSVGAASSLVGDSDDTEGGRLGLLAGGKSTASHGGTPGVWGVVPAVLTIVVVVGTAVMAMAALRLLMVTRRDMEILTRRLGSVEARSAEAPARFHEAHVRLQELQRNTTALWDALTAAQGALTRQQAQVTELQTMVNSLQQSVQATPGLSSLPQDVQELQSSVAAFGSTLRDVQSGVAALSKEQRGWRDTVTGVQASVTTLYNNTRVTANSESSDAAGTTIGFLVTFLSKQVAVLTDNVTSIQRDVDKQKVELQENVKTNEALLDSRLSNITSSLRQELPAGVREQLIALQGGFSNLSVDVTGLHDDMAEQSGLIRQLAQNVSVVKGVEKKLEGSQLQLASGVSDVKQQLVQLQHAVSSLTPTTSTPPTSITTLSRGDVASSTAQPRGARRRRSVAANGNAFLPGQRNLGYLNGDREVGANNEQREQAGHKAPQDLLSPGRSDGRDNDYYSKQNGKDYTVKRVLELERKDSGHRTITKDMMGGRFNDNNRQWTMIDRDNNARVTSSVIRTGLSRGL